MRFKQFLNEEEKYSDVMDCLETIKKECGPFINDMASSRNWIHRGMKNIRTDVMSEYPQPKNRLSKDSSDSFNLFFNSGIELAFGIPQVRSKSVFGIGRNVLARSYGDVCFLFPKGNYSYIWSSHIQDSFSDDDRIYRRFSDELKYLTKGTDLDELVIKALFRSIFREGEGDYELAFQLIDKDTDKIDEILKKQNINASPSQFKAALKETFSAMYVDSKQIVDAVNDSREILLYEADGYFYLPQQMVSKHLGDSIFRTPEQFLFDFFFGGA